MNYSISSRNGEILLSSKDRIDLSRTLFCGQSFSFCQTKKKEGVIFEGVSGGRFLSARQAEEGILLSGAKEADLPYWIRFFNLDIPYADIHREILSHSGKYSPFMTEVLGAGEGLRLLRQDPWETLLTFILSQNNNIPRITKLVAALSEMFGEKLATPTGVFYACPSAATLASVPIEEILKTKCGFRAKYISDAARRVVSGEISLSAIETMPFDEALAALTKIAGVGNKVASCALLYGFGKYEAFPIDVWMKKVIEKRFDGVCPNFGAYRGIAQLYLFDFERKAGAQ